MSQYTIEGWVPASGIVKVPTGAVVTDLRVEGASVSFTAGDGYVEPAQQYIGKKFQADVQEGTASTAGGDARAGASLLAAAGLSYDKLFQLYGDDEMIIATFANRPLATAVAAGKEFMATDLGNMRWVSDGTQWILLKPCQIYGDATQQSIVDSAGQATTESTLFSLNIPANALDTDDGLLLDLVWSCTNSAAAKRIRARFGGTVLFNVDLTTHLVFRQSVKLRNRNSRAAQVSQGNSTTNFGPIGSVGPQTFNVDFAAAQVLTITGQFPVTGSGANTLTLEEVTINGI